MSDAIGWATVALAVLLFGIFPVPTKSVDAGDGVFFQLAMCCGIYLVGTAVHFVQCTHGRNDSLSDAAATSCPQFEPMSALGGAIWCLSNLLLIPLVSCIGIGPCMMIWGVAESLTGWATARGGWFGVSPQLPSRPELNYGGVALAVGSLLLMALAQPAVADGSDKSSSGTGPVAADSAAEAVVSDGSSSLESGHVPLLIDAAPRLTERAGAAGINSGGGTDSPAPAPSVVAGDHVQPGTYDFTRRLSPVQKRAFGLAGSLVAGCLSGSTFTPSQALIDAQATSGAGPRGGPYPGSGDLFSLLFSHFSGILFASIAFTAVYAAAVKGRPFIAGPVFLPALISGLLWGIAMVCWTLANQHLSIVVAFPLVTVGPGLVNAAIGGLVFREIVGVRNWVLVGGASLLYCAGAVLIAVGGGAS